MQLAVLRRAARVCTPGGPAPSTVRVVRACCAGGLEPEHQRPEVGRRPLLDGVHDRVIELRSPGPGPVIVEVVAVHEVEEPADKIGGGGQLEGEPRLPIRFDVKVRQGLLQERTEGASVVVRTEVAMRFGTSTVREVCDRNLGKERLEVRVLDAVVDPTRTTAAHFQETQPF